MTLIEFLTKRLVPGQKVSLITRDYNGNRERTECVFRGFCNFMGKNIVRYPDEEIIPVFNQIGKNGRPSRKRIYQPTLLELIENVIPEPEKEEEAPLHAETLLSLSSAALSLNERCRTTALDIIRDMDTLFPGKKILFDSSNTVGGALDAKYCDFPGLITAARWDRGHLLLTISYENVEESDNVFVYSWPDFLMYLIDAIRDPYIPEDDENAKDSFAYGFKWKDIPDTGAVHTLHASQLIQMLSANLWYEEEGKNLIDRDTWSKMEYRDRNTTFIEQTQKD